jgi:NADH-quinone oxidoreductase subunit C
MTAPGPRVAAVVAGLAGPTGDVPPVYDVAADDWWSTLRDLAGAGASYLDFLSAVDRPGEGRIEVLAHVAEPGTWWHAIVRTWCDRERPHLRSVVDVLAGADWHERETHEMFGVVFDGHPDLRPLLLPAGLGQHPLRKDTVLAARAVRPWPGAADPGEAGSARPSRRRQSPPGVPDGWIHEPGEQA